VRGTCRGDLLATGRCPTLMPPRAWRRTEIPRRSAELALPARRPGAALVAITGGPESHRAPRPPRQERRRPRLSANV